LDLRAVLATDVAWRRVVADCELVQGGLDAAHLHVGATVDGDTADTGSVLPEHLGQMTYLVEDVITETGLAKVAVHIRELALIPALRDAGGDVERVARDSEEVLAISDAVRNVMRKVTCLGGNTGILFAGRVPYKGRSSVIGTGSVVMVQNSVAVVDA